MCIVELYDSINNDVGWYAMFRATNPDYINATKYNIGPLLKLIFVLSKVSNPGTKFKTKDFIKKLSKTDFSYSSSRVFQTH